MSDSPALRTAEAAKDALAELPGVESVAIRPAGDHEYGERRLVSIVTPAQYDRVPPRILRCLTEYDLGVADVSTQGEQYVIAAV